MDNTTKHTGPGWDWDEALAAMPRRWTEPMPDVIPFVLRLQREQRQRVYDLGCGVGRHTVYLAQLGFDVVASDISDSGVRKTKEWLAREKLQVDVSRLDMHDMPFDDGTFDAVVAVNVVYHATRDDVEDVLAQISRVLKPGGFLFITFKSTASSDFGQGIELALRTWAPASGIEQGVPHYYTDEAEVRRLLRDFAMLKLIHKLEQDLEANDGKLRAHWVSWARKG